MTDFLANFEGLTVIQLTLVGTCMVAVWFLPVILALFFNRKQVKLIAIACVPAGLSVIVWSAVLMWAVTGKAVEKYLPQKIRQRLAQ